MSGEVPNPAGLVPNLHGGVNGITPHADGAGMGVAGAVPTVNAAAASSGGASNQVLDKKRLQELVKEVDTNEQLDEDVEDLLLRIADDFIEQTVSNACALARHRKANAIDVKDVKLVLGKIVTPTRPYCRVIGLIVFCPISWNLKPFQALFSLRKMKKILEIESIVLYQRKNISSSMNHWNDKW